MGILQDLGRGLRAGGGVLNPQVAARNAQEDLINQQNQQKQAQQAQALQREQNNQAIKFRLDRNQQMMDQIQERAKTIPATNQEERTRLEQSFKQIQADTNRIGQALVARSDIGSQIGTPQAFEGETPDIGDILPQPKPVQEKSPTKASLALAKAGGDKSKAFDLLNQSSGENITVEGADGSRVSINRGVTSIGSSDKPTNRRRIKTLEDAEDSLNATQTALDKIEATPGAAGVTGAIVDSKLFGLIGQLPGGGAARNAISRALTGEDAEKVTQIRTRARTLVAQSLSQITGEESGRFTEAERQIAEQTLKQLSPSSSIDQIRGAYKTMIEISITSRDRNRQRLNISPKHDLSNAKGREGLAQEMLNRGFSEEEAIEYVISRVRGETL